MLLRSLVAESVGRDLGREEDVLTRQARLAHRGGAGAFILVSSSRVDVAVAGFEGLQDYGLAIGSGADGVG